MSGPKRANRFSVFDIGRAPAFLARQAAVVEGQRAAEHVGSAMVDASTNDCPASGKAVVLYPEEAEAAGWRWVWKSESFNRVSYGLRRQHTDERKVGAVLVTAISVSPDN